MVYFSYSGRPLVYGGLLATVNLAHKLIKIRKEWYESEEVRLSVEASRAKQEETMPSNTVAKDKYLEQHIDKMYQIKLDEGVKELVEKYTKNDNEAVISIQKGVCKIIKLIGSGTEFHPSLNPPSFIEEDEQKNFYVDYDSLKKTLETEEAPKQIEHASEQHLEDEEHESTSE